MEPIEDSPSATEIREEHPSRRHVTGLALAALGVVYGDIGTSPLYALRECFHGIKPLAASAANVLGVLSLIFWSLMIVISLKYLVLLMRADNRGEGGILALLALLNPWQNASRRNTLLIGLGLFGAALLYGDGVITPAISVLSAIEGLHLAAPAFGHYVVPLTCIVLVLLFLFQKRGTAGVGAVFGPVMVVWFLTLAILGLRGIIAEPRVLAAVNPLHAVYFFRENGGHGFMVLGSVFLVVTGGEALYADMGHFGRVPVRWAWFGCVLPALLLNYFGQGALILGHPLEVINPFYHLAPPWALYPLILIATLATIVASQAVISGAFSLTRQAVQLNQSPHVRIIQTSSEEIGQVYVPAVNWILMLTTIALVLGFRSSANLAAAYGVAVTTTMVITTVLVFFLMRRRWHWGLLTSGLAALLFLTVDLSFFCANMLKVSSGGWFPLAAGVVVFTLMTTWRRGREILNARLYSRSGSLEDFLLEIARTPPYRLPGTAVFMTARPVGTPPMLIHHLTHNRVLHKQVILLTVITEEVPRVSAADRLVVTKLSEGFARVIVRYGFMQSPNIPVALRQCEHFDLMTDPETTTFYLGRETLIPTPAVPGMFIWREKLFAFMARNSQRATSFFNIPPDRVVEIGQQVEI